VADSPPTFYTSRPNTTPEAELNALANVYRYVLFDLQARRGGPHDLTSGSTKKWTTKTRNERKGKE
jgi:hypothetical protein